MNVTILRDLGVALLFILLQVLVFNQIHLFGVAVPLVFIYIYYLQVACFAIDGVGIDAFILVGACCRYFQ